MLLFKMCKTGIFSVFFLMFLGLGFSSAYAAQVLCSMQDGQPADGKTVLEKQGKKYEFCCSGCLQQFKDSPEKFVSELHSPPPAELVSAEAACSTVCSD